MLPLLNLPSDPSSSGRSRTSTCFYHSSSTHTAAYYFHEDEENQGSPSFLRSWNTSQTRPGAIEPGLQERPWSDSMQHSRLAKQWNLATIVAYLHKFIAMYKLCSSCCKISHQHCLSERRPRVTDTIRRPSGNHAYARRTVHRRMCVLPCSPCHFVVAQPPAHTKKMTPQADVRQCATDPSYTASFKLNLERLLLDVSYCQQL